MHLYLKVTLYVLQALQAVSIVYGPIGEEVSTRDTACATDNTRAAHLHAQNGLYLSEG